MPKSAQDLTFSERFWKYLKKYMLPLGGGILPIPLTSLGLFPVFEGHKGFLTVWGPVFCFMIIGFVFFSRTAYVKNLFYTKDLLMNQVVRILPIALIVLAVACLVAYIIVMQKALQEFPIEVKAPLETTDLRLIPNSALLIVLCLGLFMLTQAAIVIFAMTEFVIEYLKIDQLKQIAHQQSLTSTNG